MPRYVILLLALQISTSGGVAPKNNASTPIRVLLDQCAKTATFESYTSRFIVDIDEKNLSLDLGSKISMKWISESKIELNGKLFQAKTLRVSPSLRESWFRYAAEVHRGELRVYPQTRGLAVVNVLPIEQYLLGILTGEMSESWEMEVLKAQAIASRTFALYKTQHPRSTLYDVDRTTNDQVFVTKAIESHRIQSAVKSTAGLVMKKNGHPLQAYFHSRCGGTTEYASKVWKEATSSGLRSVNCPYCQKIPYPWTTEVKNEELAKAFGVAHLAFLSPFTIHANRNESGRVTDVTLIGPEFSKTITANTLRSRLGFTRFKSAQFDWKYGEDHTVFKGKGYGHGVGMCQWGARHLARLGKNFREILIYYYPGVDIK